MTTLQGADLETRRSVFSGHDFDQLRKIRLLPLSSSGQHVGIVLVAASEASDVESAAVDVLFSSVARLVATKITQPHVGAVEDLPGKAVVLGPDGLLEEAERLARHSRAPLVVAELDLSVLVSPIAADHESLDHHRLADEITRFLSIMLAPHAHIGTTQHGRTIAIFDGNANAGLLLHQAVRGLRKLFPELRDSPELLRGSTRWDAATTDFSDLLAGLSPEA